MPDPLNYHLKDGPDWSGFSRNKRYQTGVFKKFEANVSKAYFIYSKWILVKI